MERIKLNVESPLTGNQIIELRKKLALSQSAFGELIGVNYISIWRYETLNDQKPKMRFYVAENLNKLLAGNKNKTEKKEKKNHAKKEN